MSVLVFAQTQDEVNTALENASKEFSVPTTILKSVAFIQSRFTQIIPNESVPLNNNMPYAFGVMGLRDDSWFGHSLTESAKLINEQPSELKLDYVANIRGAAAYISSIAKKLGIERTNIDNWKKVLELYSGIPQSDVQEFYSYGVFDRIERGIEFNGKTYLDAQKANMSLFSDAVKPLEKRSNKLAKVPSSDYPDATWDPSPNYYDGTFATTKPFGAVFHYTAGEFAGSLSYLKTTDAQASAHYIMRSADGYLVQLVAESNGAWHARCWNKYMLGVEHEAVTPVDNWFSETMYRASAKLYRHFCDKFGIPMDRNHIIGHDQWSNAAWVTWAQANAPFDPTCNDHSDPGPSFNWNHFMDLLVNGKTTTSAAPTLVSTDPAKNATTVSIYDPIKINFSRQMDTKSQDGITIVPAVAGKFSWTGGNAPRYLVFSPSQDLAENTDYKIILDSKKIMAADSVYFAKNDTIKFRTGTAVTALLLEKSNPIEGQKITTTPLIKLTFNTTVDTASVRQNVQVLDKTTSKAIMIKDIKSDRIYGGKYVLSLTLADSLKWQNDYSLVISASLKNSKFTFGTAKTINFKTMTNTYIKGTLIDNFSTKGSWWDPGQSGSTVNIDPATSFAVTNSKYISAGYSGKLTYKFSGVSGGYVRVHNSGTPALGSDNASQTAGIWVYGDGSNNYLEFLIYATSPSANFVAVDTISWTGWKFVELKTSNVGSGAKRFASLCLKQNPNGDAGGEIYFDDLQKRDPSVSNERINSIVNNYELMQNYPNPFNPSTNIKFSIPQSGNISLKIYDVLGNEVATLYNGYMNAGSQNINFNASNLASGTYFYQLKTNSSTLTKKMLLVK